MTDAGFWPKGDVRQVVDSMAGSELKRTFKELSNKV